MATPRQAGFFHKGAIPTKAINAADRAEEGFSEEIANTYLRRE